MPAVPRLLAFATGLALSAGAHAEDALPDPAAPPRAISLAVTASALSQYRFRGLAQSDGQPAAMLDVQATHDGGAYGGITLVTTGRGPARNTGWGEARLYAGYDHPLGASATGLDLSVRGYLFAGGGTDRIEAGTALHRQIGPLGLRGGVAWSPPRHWPGDAPGAGTRDTLYGFAEARGDMPQSPFSLALHWGWTTGGLDYTRAHGDYRLAITYTRRRLALDLALVGTTLSHGDALAAPQGPAHDAQATFATGRAAALAGMSYAF